MYEIQEQLISKKKLEQLELERANTPSDSKSVSAFQRFTQEKGISLSLIIFINT